MARRDDFPMQPTRWYDTTHLEQLLGYLVTAVIALHCLRVSVGPTPEHWGQVVIPTALLTCLTISLARKSLPIALSRHRVSIACAGYVLLAVGFFDCASWYWLDQLSLAAFCAITALTGITLRASLVEDSTPQAA